MTTMPYVTSVIDRLNARVPFKAIVQLEGPKSSVPVYREALIIGPAREVFCPAKGKLPIRHRLVLVHIEGEHCPRQLAVERILVSGEPRRTDRRPRSRRNGAG